MLIGKSGHQCLELDGKVSLSCYVTFEMACIFQIWILRYDTTEIFDPATMTVSVGPSEKGVSKTGCNVGVAFENTIYAACNTEMLKLKEDRSAWELVMRVTALNGWSRDYHDALLVSRKICGSGGWQLMH